MQKLPPKPIKYTNIKTNLLVKKNIEAEIENQPCTSRSTVQRQTYTEGTSHVKR